MASATKPTRSIAPAFQRMNAGAAPRSVAAAGAKAGDYVQVSYVGTLDSGEEFDRSKPNSPLEFLIGGGSVIRGFDLAVTGLEVGQARKSRIEPEDAYGKVDPTLMLKVPVTQAPKGLKEGVKVQLSNGMTATCVKIDDKEIELDLNHELAGQPLTFAVELVGLTKAENLAKATFGAGCFWGPELKFQRVPGVIATETGYTNGKVANPTYDEVCTGQTGASEVVQVVYDTAAVTFEELLDVFWKEHDPTTLNRQGGDRGTQYRSGIYCHSPEQVEAAKKSLKAAQARFSDPIVTEIVPIDKYSAAEPYHQKYLARGGRFGKPQSAAKNCTDPVRCYG